VPSQKGDRSDILHPQKSSSSLSIAMNFTDLNFPSFLWVPSQNGCFGDKPQAHQK